MANGDEVVDADADVVAGQAPPSVRKPLDRDRIVSAAVRFIDESGLPGLSMRRLGAVLGVEAMSLYRYVPGRENLLDAVVDSIIEEMRQDEDVLDAPTDGWQDFLQRLAHGRAAGGARAPEGVPAGGVAATGGALAPATAAQPDVGGGVPRRAVQRGVQR
jgi:AcrR family transcriptional regulator